MSSPLCPFISCYCPYHQINLKQTKKRFNLSNVFRQLYCIWLCFCHSTNTVHAIRRHRGYTLSAALGVCMELKLPWWRSQKALCPDTIRGVNPSHWDILWPRGKPELPQEIWRAESFHHLAEKTKPSFTSCVGLPARAKWGGKSQLRAAQQDVGQELQTLKEPDPNPHGAGTANLVGTWLKPTGLAALVTGNKETHNSSLVLFRFAY